MQVDFRLCKQMPSLNQNPEDEFQLYGRPLQNWYVINMPPIVWLQRHLAGRCRVTCR